MLKLAFHLVVVKGGATFRPKPRPAFLAEGVRQAVGSRIDAVMRPSPRGSAAPGSPSGWAGRATGTLASLAGVSFNPSSPAEIGRRSGSLELPAAR